MRKLKEIKPGEGFKFGGYEWIKLEDGLVITKDIVTEKEFDSDCNNSYMTSKVKNYLTDAFMDYLCENGADISSFDFFPLDLTADDGTKEHEACNVEIGLLTADLYRKNRYWLEPINDSWWLATPKSYYHKNNDTVMYVDADGALKMNLHGFVIMAFVLFANWQRIHLLMYPMKSQQRIPRQRQRI